MAAKNQQQSTEISEIYAMVSFGHKEREGEKNANFFFFTYSGMVDAANLIDRDIKVEWHGPNAWDPVPEIKAIQDLTARQVDGIIVTAADKTALDPSINAAIEANIPVINFDADSPASARLTHVGTDNYKAGYLAGQTMAEWLEEQGDVAVSTIQHADHLAERLEGFRDAMRQFNPQSNIYVAYDSGSIDIDEFGQQDFTEYRQSYIRMLQAHPGIRGLFATYASPGAGAAEAVEELGLEDKAQILAFDFDEIIIELIGSEKIRATVGQDPYLMGYVSMILLHAARHAPKMPVKSEDAWRISALVDFLNSHPTVHKNTALKLQNIISQLEIRETALSIDTGARILRLKELVDLLAKDFGDMRDSIIEKIEALGQEVEVRKKAERDLLKLNAELEQRVRERTSELVREKYIVDTFMENIPDRIYFKDLEGRVTRANKAHVQALGLSDPAEEIGKSDFDFFPEEKARAKFEQEQEIIHTGQPVLSLEEPGGEGWLLTTKMPLRDENGRVIGTFGISRDITKIKQAQATLEQAYAEVEKQVEERTAELRREVAERERAQTESLRLQQEIIEAQQRAIQELSTPVIPVLELPQGGSVIVLPLVGSIDTLRAQDITRRVLAGIQEHRAQVVIIDITGVPLVDSGVAAYLNKTIQAARLKGAQTIVTGISDAVAETIVDLGIDWSEVDTLADLRTGLQKVLAAMKPQT